jgi:hypothetical protein
MRTLTVIATLVAAALTMPLAANAAPKEAPVSGAGGVDPQVRSVWKATQTYVWSLKCVNQAQMHQLNNTGGGLHSAIWGLSEPKLTKVWLDARLCRSISTKDGLYVLALTTIGHEASHLRGVVGEGKAECYGVRFAWAYLTKTGQVSEYGASRLRAYLLNDAGRPREYRLNGRCSLTGPYHWG